MTCVFFVENQLEVTCTYLFTVCPAHILDKHTESVSSDPIHFDVDTVLWNRIIVDNPENMKTLCV